MSFPLDMVRKTAVCAALAGLVFAAAAGLDASLYKIVRARLSGTPAAKDPALVKFLGNVPAGVPQGGVLRHKGWQARKVDLPVPKHGSSVVGPAEIEIE